MRAVDLIIAKRQGQEHSTAEIEWLIGGFTRGDVADYQMAAWMMAVCLKGMTDRETAALTRAMAASGDQLDISPAAPFVVAETPHRDRLGDRLHARADGGRARHGEVGRTRS